MRRLSLGLFLSLLVSLVIIAGACAPKATPTPTLTPTPTPKPTPTPESVADFYKNNAVTFLVSNEPAAGADYTARVIASFWSGFTGGNAKVINKAGGAGIPACNQVYSLEKADGLTIAAVEIGPTINAVLTNLAGVQYDLNKINWLALSGISPPHALVVGPKSPYTTLADLQKAKGLKWGNNGTANAYAVSGAIAIKIFKLDVTKMIPGYQDTGPVALSLGRGEIDIMMMSPSDLERFSSAGLVGPRVAQLSYERSPAWKDVPCAAELVNLTEEDKKLLDIHATRLSGRAFWVRPEVSKDKVEFLRTTIMKIVTNPDAITMIEKVHSPLLPPLTGDAVAKAIAAQLAQPPEYVDKLTQLIRQISQ